jgi:hypothetical protein
VEDVEANLHVFLVSTLDVGVWSATLSVWWAQNRPGHGHVERPLRSFRGANALHKHVYQRVRRDVSELCAYRSDATALGLKTKS